MPEGEHVLALAYAGFAEGDRTADAFYRLNRARSWDEFVDAMALWGAPQQNVVYADVEGNIGLFTPGRLPVRRGHDGAFPVPGWTGDIGWDGFVPVEELPQRLNPTGGRLVNANNAVVGPRLSPPDRPQLRRGLPRGADRRDAGRRRRPHRLRP